MSISHQITGKGWPRRVLGLVVGVVVLLAASGEVLPAGWGAGGKAKARGVGGPRPAAVVAGRGLPVAGQAAAGVGPGAVAGQAAAGVAPGAVAGPRVAARAAILADEATGQVLFERNAEVARAMASTTKVMTALLALERLDERRVVRIGAGPPRVGEESLRLRRGERLTVHQLLLGLLVKSANDAGVALAEAVDGSEAAFVRRMNRKAAALGLAATHYVTPYGLDRPGHQTSARDLAHLWEVAMRRADFRSLVATRTARIPGSPLSLRRFVTTNQLLGSYRWTVGGKTGFTNHARRCLVASASRGGRRLVAVALGSPNAFADVRALFEYGFAKFVRARLAARGQPVSQAPAGPATYQAAADVDALVRLDQLTRVRLTTPTPTQGGAAGGSSGTGGTDAGAAGGSASAGTAAGVPGGATAAWFTVGGLRLARVQLAQVPGATAPTPATPSSFGPATPTSGPTPGVTGTPGAVPTVSTPAPGAPGATLVLGAVVRPWAVPPGAPAPTFDPFLRRAPP
jgi:serine-type D-Ala-D-Ala carboxypeptidase (penicillin-binding protein 5/6)